MPESEDIGPERYPVGPTMLERTATPEDAVEHAIKVVEASRGQAWFVTQGRSGRRLVRKLTHRLPNDYQAEVFTYQGDSELPTARFRFGRYETRLLIRRKDLPPSEPPEFPATSGRQRPPPVR